MKKFKIAALGLVMAVLCVTLAACGTPRTADTSAVAGTYYQHDGGDAKIEASGLVLKGDGTWETLAKAETQKEDGTREAYKEEAHNGGTFTIDGENISFYSNMGKTMMGTIKDKIMTLRVWVVMGWEDDVKYYLDEPAA